MKKLVLFLVAAFAIGLQAVADSGGVLIDFHRKSKSKNDTPPHRAPMYLPIDVYYDDTTRQFEVVCDGETDAQVYLCDENGATLDYAPCLNSTLTVPDGFSGVAVIIIDADNWEGRGETVI